MTTAIEIAQRYTRRGWRVVPVEHKSKASYTDGWQDLRLNESDLPKHFNGIGNVGVLLGEPSGWIVDVDLDHRLAADLAPEYLPGTEARFGRVGNPGSHFIYKATSPVKTKKWYFEDDPKKPFLEL